MPLLQPSIDPSAIATDDDLCELLDRLRRHVRDAPEGTWPADVVAAARTISRAASRELRDRSDG